LRQPNFRIWNQQGTSFKHVYFYSDWFEIAKPEAKGDETAQMFNRQAVFGKKFQAQLGEMTVILIGCGGRGAIFAEMLGRLGVQKWILIDSDRLETVNLNRMQGATPEMVEQQMYKVEYVKQQIYPTGSWVRAIPSAIEQKKADNEIAASDLIVVATARSPFATSSARISLQIHETSGKLGNVTRHQK